MIREYTGISSTTMEKNVITVLAKLNKITDEIKNLKCTYNNHVRGFRKVANQK